MSTRPGPDATISPLTLETTMDVGGFWRTPIAIAVEPERVFYLAIATEGPPTWVPEEEIRHLNLRHA